MSSIRDRYEAYPEPGMLRFWARWFAWVEDYPSVDFPMWETGHGHEYVLRPSKAEEASAKGLPPLIGCLQTTGVSKADIAEFYYTIKVFNALVDAESEDALKTRLTELFGAFQLGYAYQRPRKLLSEIEAESSYVLRDGRAKVKEKPAPILSPPPK